MKTCFHFLILGMAALPFPLHAQTNSPVAATNAEPPVTLIASASIQTNSAAAAATNSVTTTNSITATNSTTTTSSPTNTVIRTIDITADHGVFKAGEAVYIGNVRVVYPRMKLTCERLTATSSDGKGRPDYIVAETNVVIDALDDQGRPVHATAKKAINNYKVTSSATNDTIELSGNPHLESHLGPTTGDPITWDRVNNTVRASQVHQVIIESEPKTQAKPRTNAPIVVPQKRLP